MSPIQQIQDSTAQLKAAVMHRVNKPDHPFWRKVGVFFDYIAIPASITIGSVVPGTAGKIIMAIGTVGSIIIKGLTKLTTE